MVTLTQKKHVISLLVSNKPGVLIRIALVFSRRGYNIDSLVVSETQDPRFSMMNITASGDPDTLHLILAQLNKLVDVVHARDYTDSDILQKELALVKINCNADQRTQALQIAQAFKAKASDVSQESLIFEVSGQSEKLDAFQKMVAPFGIREVVRSGKILMARGLETT
jgi:acetolactate synthase-1/3 small subunit